MSTAVTVMNSFEVPAGKEHEFFEMWIEVNAYLKRKPGYVSHRLHRAIAPDAPFRFVNVANWASMARFQDAHDTGFRELVEHPKWSGLVPHRAFFEVVHEAAA
jgi:heme oxygenase (mycobilin-producing)